MLIPARRNQDIDQDVVGLAEADQLTFRPREPPAPAPVPVHRPERVRKREAARQKTLAQRRAETSGPLGPSTVEVRSEIAAVSGLDTYSACPIPLQAIVNREVYADGRREYWVLLDTGPVPDPARSREDYQLRTTIEERHRQRNSPPLSEPQNLHVKP